MNKITIFRNVMSTDTPYYPSVDTIFDRIKKGNCKELVSQIRKEKDPAKRNEIKKNLPAICFSGIFTKRADKSIESHSGYICLDFDKFPTKKEMVDTKQELSGDPYVMAVFVSPSGDGLKVIVKIPEDIEGHKLYFDALANYFSIEEFDRSCGNISRVCYESYDPQIYINYDSDVWEEKEDEDVSSVNDNMTIDNSIVTLELKDDQEKITLLHKWWEKKTGGLVEGDRNNSMFILCSTFNQFGIPMYLADHFVTSMAQKGFNVNEIRQVLNSAYSSVDQFGTKVFEDRKKVDNYVERIKKGESRKEIKDDLIKIEGVDPDDTEKLVKGFENKASNSVHVFWTKSEKGKVEVDPYMFSEYLSSEGFFQYVPNGAENYVFIHRRSNLIYNTNEDKIKKHVLNGYLKGLDDKSVYNYFAQRTGIFKYDFLSLMEEANIKTIMDTPDRAHLFYSNGVVVITKDDIELVPFEEFPSWVWANQIVDRNFVKSKNDDCDWKVMINDFASGEQDRVKSIESTIGYLLHSYKDPTESPAVIINDEVISDHPEGGTGKSMFADAIALIKNRAKIDGKNFDVNNRFSYQTVKTDTQVLEFDDVKPDFKFDKLFSIITGGITLEYKNEKAIKLDFEHSPKIVISTNYSIPGEGNSHERRRWELEFSQYYSKGGMTPIEKFGRRLFHDWDENDWIAFDNYMVNCLQYFLRNGLVKSRFKNLKQRKFYQSTTPEFAEWVEDENNKMKTIGVRTHLNDMFSSFVTDNPDYMRMRRSTFGKWVDKYGEYAYNARPKKGRDALGTHVTFEDKRPKVKQQKMKL